MLLTKLYKYLPGKLNALQLQATLDPNAAQKLADDIGRLLNQKITISNINVDTVSGIKAGQQYDSTSFDF